MGEASSLTNDSYRLVLGQQLKVYGDEGAVIGPRFYRSDRLPPIMAERTSRDNCSEGSLTAEEDDGAECIT